MSLTAVSLIQIIESCFDTYKFERAFVARTAGGPSADDPRLLEPVAIISGIACRLDGKPSHLAAGLACCQPLDQHLAEHWPVFTDVLVDGVWERWWNMSDDPGVVSAVRRFQDLELADGLVEGMPL